jgi:AcrR family transcriptional regulator
VAALNRRLGVSHNLIHQRFGSKEGLWYAAVDFAFGQVAEEIDIDADMVEQDLASRCAASSSSSWRSTPAILKYCA